MKQRIPIIYLFTYQKLKDKSRGGVMPRKSFAEIVTRMNHVKKRYVPLVLEEFKLMKLVSSINKSEIKILNCRINLKNTSSLYKGLGMY